jgi:hypothetical protein
MSSMAQQVEMNYNQIPGKRLTSRLPGSFKYEVITMIENSAPRKSIMLIRALLLASLTISAACAQSRAGNEKLTTVSASVSSKPAHTSTPTRYLPNRPPKREAAYYGLFWGVDSLNVKAVESGELIRFSYRVLDANKAKAINDKKIDAFLISPAAHARLSVPSLEKVGQLRQVNTPEAGKSYRWHSPTQAVR